MTQELLTDGGLPERLVDLAREVERLALADAIDLLPVDLESPQGKFFLSRSPRESRTTVTIDGDRGAGKTTLLMVALLRLAERSDVAVLPVIQPERLTGQDSVFGRVIESLADYVYHCHPDAYRRRLGDDETTLSNEFDRLAGIEAATRRESLQRFAIESDAVEAANDALAATRRSSEFDSMWRPFVSTVLSELGLSRLIVPIDDADLSPEHLPWLLADIRRLDDHPLVTCILAVNSHDLRDFLRGATLRTSGLTEQAFPRVGSVVSRQIEKALPYQNWVRLRPWRPDRRLGFRGLGSPEDPSLEELLQSLEFGDLPVGARMRSLRGAPTQFASALPARPRPLERLAIELAESPADRRPDALMHTIEGHLEDSLAMSAQPISNPLSWWRGTSGIEVSLDLSPWHFFTDLSSKPAVHFADRRTIIGDEVDIEYRFLRSVGSVAHTGPSESSPILSSDAVGSVLLLLDLEAHGAFSSASIAGGRPSQGGTSWRRPRISVDGVETDHDFMVPPRYDGYLEAGVLNEVLNDIVGVIESSKPRKTADFIEWFALTQMWLIHELQRDPTGRTIVWRGAARNLGPEQVHGILRRDFDWQRHRRRIARFVFKSLAETYRSTVSHASAEPGVSQYQTWFESLFLWSLHPVVFADDVVDVAVREWLSTVTKAGRAAQAKSVARDSLRSRLNGAGSATWGDPIADLGERLGLGPEFDSRRRQLEVERSERRIELAETVGSAATRRNTEGDAKQVKPSKFPRRTSDEIRQFLESVASNWSSHAGGDPARRTVDRERLVVELCGEVLSAIRRGDLLSGSSTVLR